jgi:hypothetical protein
MTMLPAQPKLLAQVSSQRQSSTKTKDKRFCLGRNFNPGNNAVICGRGKACCESSGNLNLKRIVNSYTRSYATAMTKEQKSAIISRIISTVKETEGGLFVKHVEGTWWEVDDGYAKEKVGYMLRDILHTRYRSSTRAKEARKKLGTDLSLGTDRRSGSGSSKLYGDVEALQSLGTQDHCQNAFDEVRSASFPERAIRREVVVDPESPNESRIRSSRNIPVWSATRTAEQNGLYPAFLGSLQSSTTSSGKSAVEELRSQTIYEFDLPGSPATTTENLTVDGNRGMKGASKRLLPSNSIAAASNLAPDQMLILSQCQQATTSIDDLCRDGQDSSSIETIEYLEAVHFTEDEEFQEIFNSL